ncbi:MAG: c-type cytochrome [Novosphingobium sp.]|nr:c-type cytochrome [Novosphingobium sp.]
MKTLINLGPAAAALLMLAGCNENSGTVPAEPPPDNSDKAVEVAQHSAGEAPVDAPAGAQDVGAPAAQDKSSDVAPPGEAAAAAKSEAPAKPPAAYLQCRSCHSVEAGKNGIGPSLAGIFGKPAASVAGFRYSSALQASGIVWDRAKLDEWLAGPTKMVPGTRMVLPVRNEGQRKAVLDYMETLN